MKHNIFSLLLCAALFAACGDDDNGNGNGNDDGGDNTPPPSSSDVRTGKLQGGSISGMHYATASQSGVTGADGSFQYKDGETVTFSLGATTFGSAAAHESVTLFELYGVSAADVGLDAIQDLGTQDIQTSNVDRLLNAAIVLIALDADATWTNGIDLTGRDAALADTGIALNKKAVTFLNEDIIGLAVRIPHFGFGYYDIDQTPLDSAFAYLCDSAGVDLSGLGFAGIGIDNDGDEQPDQTRTYTLDDRSFATAIATSGAPSITVQRDANGRLTGIGGPFTATFTYNARGQLTAIGGGPATAETTFTEDGRLASITDPIGNTFNASFDAATRTLTSGDTVITFDAAGQLVTSVVTRRPGEADEERETTTNTYDADGNLLTSDVVTTDAAGETLARGVTTWVYVDGQLQSVNHVRPASGAGSETLFTYDSAGRLLTRTYSMVPPAGAAAIRTELDTRTYDSAGRTATTRQQRRNGDGTIVTYDVTITVTYDANNNVVSTVGRDGEGAFSFAQYPVYAQTHNRVVALMQLLVLRNFGGPQ